MHNCKIIAPFHSLSESSSSLMQYLKLEIFSCLNQISRIKSLPSLYAVWYLNWSLQTLLNIRMNISMWMLIKIACNSVIVYLQTWTIVVLRNWCVSPFWLRKHSLNYSLIFNICKFPISHLFGQQVITDVSLSSQGRSVFTNFVTVLGSKMLH